MTAVAPGEEVIGLYLKPAGGFALPLEVVHKTSPTATSGASHICDWVNPGEPRAPDAIRDAALELFDPAAWTGIQGARAGPPLPPASAP